MSPIKKAETIFVLVGCSSLDTLLCKKNIGPIKSQGKASLDGFFASENVKFASKEIHSRTRAEMNFTLLGYFSLNTQMWKGKYRPQEIARESFDRQLFSRVKTLN